MKQSRPSARKTKAFYTFDGKFQELDRPKPHGCNPLPRSVRFWSADRRKLVDASVRHECQKEMTILEYV